MFCAACCCAQVHAYERTHAVYKYKRDDCGPMYVTIGDGGNIVSGWVAALVVCRNHRRTRAWSRPRMLCHGSHHRVAAQEGPYRNFVDQTNPYANNVTYCSTLAYGGKGPNELQATNGLWGPGYQTQVRRKDPRRRRQAPTQR